MRRVPDPALLAKLGIVLGQEVFVEVDDGILHLGGLAEVFEDGIHIRRTEDIRQRIHDPGDPLIEVVSGDVLEELSQERIGLGDQFRRFLSAKGIEGTVIESRRKHPVGNGLCIDIGKLLRRNVVDQDFLEGIHLLLQGGIVLIDFVAFERSLDHVGEKSGFTGHHLGELFGAFDRLPDVGGELLDQEFESGEVVRKGKDSALVDHSDADGGGEFAISEIDEFEVIGKNQVVQRTFVSVKLLLVAVLFHPMQIRISDILGFDVADGDFFFVGQDVIRRTTGLSLGFVGGTDAGSKGFEEVLQVSAKGMFGGIAKAVSGIEGGKVIDCGHEKKGGKNYG